MGSTLGTFTKEIGKSPPISDGKSVYSYMFMLTLKAPRKNASENVVC